MKKVNIIKKAQEFDHIINKGRYIKNEAFNIFYVKEENDEEVKEPLFGIAVSKKLINAVGRNKNKRQIKNIVDKNKKYFKNNYKYIIMIKRNGINLSYGEKELRLLKLIQKEKNEK